MLKIRPCSFCVGLQSIESNCPGPHSERPFYRLPRATPLIYENLTDDSYLMKAWQINTEILLQ